MLAQALLTLALVVSPLSQAQSVIGKAPGFATGTTGGAGGKTVTPTTTDELVKYLTSNDALTIVLTKTFDFTGTEGTVTETGCAPWGTGSGCQLAINANNWCGDYKAGAGKVQVTYDKAGTSGIRVKSNKSIIGTGTKGVIKGKGLDISNGVSNVIIQNVQITNLNPKYVHPDNNRIRVPRSMGASTLTSRCHLDMSGVEMQSHSTAPPRCGSITSK